jgi:hypothetical protein
MEEKSDVYSLGTIMFLILYGKKPYNIRDSYFYLYPLDQLKLNRITFVP